MLRRASAFIMPTDAEKAGKEHAKQVASRNAELEKQQKLSDRRASICAAANNVLPRFDKPDLPDTPIMRPWSADRSVSSPSLSRRSTGETPFKGEKRQNPLNEKKNAEKEELQRQIAVIAERYNVNLSDAKVMLAQNPNLTYTTTPKAVPVSSNKPPKESPPVALESEPLVRGMSAMSDMSLLPSTETEVVPKIRETIPGVLKRNPSSGRFGRHGPSPLNRARTSDSVDTTLVSHVPFRPSTDYFTRSPITSAYEPSQYTASVYSPLVGTPIYDEDHASLRPRSLATPGGHTVRFKEEFGNDSDEEGEVSEAMLFDMAQRA